MTEPTDNPPAVRSNLRSIAIYPDSSDDPRLEAILEAMREGNLGFAAECEAQGFRPSTVRQWATRDTPEGFRAAYRETRQIEMDAFADDIVKTARGQDRSDRDTAGADFQGRAAGGLHFTVDHPAALGKFSEGATVTVTMS
jgi:hypothetical protein